MVRGSTRAAGFTLVELLVAIAVLAIIIAAVAQIVSAASTLTTNTNKHMDANSQARTVFDRMANDFARMIKRNDIDYIFCKANGTGGKGLNDTMFFFTEGASYFDSATFSPTLLTGYSAMGQEKNSVSLVGYRINNGTEAATRGPTYYQMERLGKALSWDGYPSINPVVFLTYPPMGTDVAGIDSDNPPNGYYSTAYFGSTIYGAYSSSKGKAPSIAGTLANNFNDGADDNTASPSPINPYRPLGSQVFRFEYSFQLKDGTASAIPVMTPSAANGVPTSNLTATAPPSVANATPTYSVGSRWYDMTQHIGYICVDASAGAASWKEIGIRDVSAVVVTLAVIDQQGYIFVKKSGIDMALLAAAFTDVTDATSAANITTTWTAAITPGAGTPSAVATASAIPQTMVSQIRVYQHYFYINNL